MATGNVYGKTNVPANLIKYTGINSETADIHIDNYNYTFEVDVKKVPNNLVFITNDLEHTEIEYNGSEAVGIDLTPITLNPEGFEEYTSEDIKKIFRKPTAGRYIEAPYVVTKEEKEIVECVVDVSEIGDNKTLNKTQVAQSFGSNFSTLVNDFEFNGLYSDYKTHDEEDPEGNVNTIVDSNAIRIGSRNNTGSFTLHLNWNVDKIKVKASIYSNDTNAQLVINGVVVSLTEESLYTVVELPHPTSTVVIENSRSSGSSGGRALISEISTVDGGMVFAEKQLAYKEYVEQNFVSNEYGRAYTLELFAADDDPLTYTNFDIYNASLLAVTDRQNREYRLNIELPEESQETNIHWNLPFKSGTIATLDDCGSLKPLADANFEYNEENDETTMSFPDGILPKAYYNDGNGVTLYFDYNSLQLSQEIDGERSVVGIINTFGPNVVAIYENGQLFKDIENDYIEADIFDGGPLNGFGCGFIDFYNVYHQQSSSPSLSDAIISSSVNPLDKRIMWLEISFPIGVYVDQMSFSGVWGGETYYMSIKQNPNGGYQLGGFYPDGAGSRTYVYDVNTQRNIFRITFTKSSGVNSAFTNCNVSFFNFLHYCGNLSAV